MVSEDKIIEMFSNGDIRLDRAAARIQERIDEVITQQGIPIATLVGTLDILKLHYLNATEKKRKEKGDV